MSGTSTTKVTTRILIYPSAYKFRNKKDVCKLAKRYVVTDPDEPRWWPQDGGQARWSYDS